MGPLFRKTPITRPEKPDALADAYGPGTVFTPNGFYPFH